MTSAALEAVKSSGWLRQLNYVAGVWTGADAGATHPVEDPATGRPLGVIPWSGAAETRRAVEAAQAAFAEWSMTTAAERAGLLLRMAQIIREDAELFASLLTLEQG